jgi:16S rRNA (adenine1518-N6/adenine1519-N6)-dimethyltransferase
MDQTIAERIVNLLPEGKDHVLLEIGPGKGVLTDLLLHKNVKDFRAVEIDSESIEYLIKKYPDKTNCFIQADFLKTPAGFFNNEKYSIIGNFPYNISSQIFFKILEHRNLVENVVCMIQKEVADRIVAPPGSKTYGILSVFLQAYFSVKLNFHVKPGSFYPAPKVTSSVISLSRNNTVELSCDEKLFFRIVKTTFNQRRKTIRNSLKTILLTLVAENDLLALRPEQLGVAEFVELTNWVDKRL